MSATLANTIIHMDRDACTTAAGVSGTESFSDKTEDPATYRHVLCAAPRH
jgi:hypothetical protein